MSDRNDQNAQDAGAGANPEPARVRAGDITGETVGTPSETQPNRVSGIRRTFTPLRDLGDLSTQTGDNAQQGMTMTPEVMHALLQQIASNNVYRSDSGMKDGDVVDRKGGISDLNIENIPQDVTKRLEWVERTRLVFETNRSGIRWHSSHVQLPSVRPEPEEKKPF